MIDYNTIVSTTQDKITLLHWLKKVETALKDASATSFKVNKKGDATLTFSIEFADGSELESGEIILQQGESVESAAIVNGHLILTLTNGDELDAGDLGGVTSFSIDAAQHLIVHYQNGTTQDLGAIFAGNVTITGDLAVTGKLDADVITSSEDEISAEKPIIELMTGYEFTAGSKEGMTLTPIYVGACKNGNKLTLVHFVSITRTGSIDVGYATFGSISIPADVLAKLYPYSIGDSGRALDYRKVDFYKKTDASNIAVSAYIEKTSVGVSLTCTGLNSLDLDTEYVARFENTFLLSDNLAA